jgi:hypothetical protein
MNVSSKVILERTAGNTTLKPAIREAALRIFRVTPDAELTNAEGEWFSEKLWVFGKGGASAETTEALLEVSLVNFITDRRKPVRIH